MSGTLICGQSAVALLRFEHRSIRTDTYLDINDLLSDLLMNSGGELPFLVRDKLLPPAIAAWEKQNRMDNCDKHRNFTKHGQECGCGFVMGEE